MGCSWRLRGKTVVIYFPEAGIQAALQETIGGASTGLRASMSCCCKTAHGMADAGAFFRGEVTAALNIPLRPCVWT